MDTLLHLAFLSSPTHASAWAHELESVGTMHVLNAARRVTLRKLILWSQTILYGAHPTNPNFLTERHPLRADAEDPFFADKIAWFDSLWDSIHTIIRPLGGAMLALAIVDPSDPATQAVAFILGGGAALAAHGGVTTSLVLSSPVRKTATVLAARREPVASAR